jgi:DNA topoisomerase I
MAKNLVIVESPAKAKTITRFLGKEYKVLASMGHIRDLPKSQMGVDTEGDFTPTYEVSKDKSKVVTELKKELKAAETLWIATDEDREGEAIGWHLLSAMKVNPKKTEVHRIVFHEITKGAIQAAVANPRQIDQNVVDAQQARRVLDRLVGYELSPLLWKKVKYGISAGRVQSVAVRLVVERERAIEAFIPEEYWSIIADLEKNTEAFGAELKKFEGNALKVTSTEEAKDVNEALQGATYTVANIDRKEMKRNPATPFITSTLQQEASRKLNYGVKRTMMLAQQLYEGMDMGDGATGLITYMRTDSVNLSKLALAQAKEVITAEYGKEYALDTPRTFKGKKGAQEAHEAIRPVDLNLKPADAAKYLNTDQAKLYELIWKRTIACQMAQAILDKTGVDITAAVGGKDTGYQFRATGQVVKFSGFMEVYMEGKDQDDEQESLGAKFLPQLEVGDELDFKKLNLNQHFTKPPARYTEASLVKKLESEGIGRPSTYAPTIGTIINRGYVEKEGKTLSPTDLARLVTDLLVAHFADVVDYKFTAEMEDKLDQVEEGKVKWVPMIKEFYTSFHANIVEKEANLTREDVVKEKILGKDEKSGLDVVARFGRFGPYVQLGSFTKEELDAMEGKPQTAPLPKGESLESVTLETALKALSLPRSLGKNAAGEEVIVTTGRFGPYMKVGKANVSLPDDYDPFEVTIDDVEEVIKAAKELKKRMAEPLVDFGKECPNSGKNILIKDGRFGPYITDGKTNVSVKKGNEPKDITFDQAVDLLEAKRKAPKRGRFKKK